MMYVSVIGASGRMGRLVVRLAHEQGHQVVGAVGSPRSAAINVDVGVLAGIGTIGVVVGDNPHAAVLGANVVVDFSLPAGFGPALRAAVKARVPLVSGTTGLSSDDHARIAVAAREIPILWASNMSIGVHILTELVRRAASVLPQYDCELTEVHHRDKVDAPSGTARSLLAEIVEAKGAGELVHGRDGQVGPRREGAIGVHAVRGGGVIGDHTVHFLGPFDRLELTHRAIRRELFAAGALRAAEYVIGKPPGQYSLTDMLNETGVL